MSQDSDAVVPLYRRPLFWVLLAALVLLALVLLVLLATRPAPAAPTSVPATPPAANPAEEPAATESATLDASLGDPVVDDDLFQVYGILSSVDESTLDRADHDPFSSSVDVDRGDGQTLHFDLPEMDIIFGEPGKDNVGPDGAGDIAGGNGAIEAWNPLNQSGLLYEGNAHWRCAEGGFSGVSFGYGTMTAREVTFVLGGDGDSIWNVYVKCANADAGDNNFDLVLQEFDPGDVEVAAWSSDPPGGFISLGQGLQRAYTSHSTGSGNCGNGEDGGCLTLNMLLYDVNTQALVILRQVGVDGEWEVLFSNF